MNKRSVRSLIRLNCPSRLPAVLMCERSCRSYTSRCCDRHKETFETGCRTCDIVTSLETYPVAFNVVSRGSAHILASIIVSRQSNPSHCNMAEYKIDRKNELYPFCIVWSPKPVITWLFPFIGHVGIGTSEGIIRDFACSNHVCENNFAYGSPDKFYQIKYELVDGEKEGWDNAIEEAVSVYSERKYSMFSDNSFSFVCMALNSVKYDGRTDWKAFSLMPHLWWKLKYVSCGSVINMWMPIVILYIFVGLMIFLIYDAAAMGAI